MYCLNQTAGISSTVLPSSPSSVTPVLKSPNMEYSQHVISVVSQPTSLISIVSDTHTTTSTVATLSVAECSTTSCSVVTSISGQSVSNITATMGMHTTKLYTNNICIYFDGIIIMTWLIFKVYSFN